MSHDNIFRAGSDHNLIVAYVRTKDKFLQRQEIWKCVRKNMNEQRTKDKASQIDWSELLYHLAPNQGLYMC